MKKFLPKKPLKTKSKPIVVDARNKLIQKNRAKIHDARDKLVQKNKKRNVDARFTLLQKNIASLKKFGEPIPSLKSVQRNALVGTAKKRPAVLKRPVLQRTAPVDMDVDMDFYSSNSLRRTVQNEIAYKPASTMPPLPTFKYIESARRMTAPLRPTTEYEADPFDCYEVPVARPYDVSEPRNLNRSVHEARMDAYPRKGILRSSSGNGMGYEGSMSLSSSRYDPSGRRYIADENSHLSSEMRTRLQRTPDSNQSAGIFSNPYTFGSRDERQISAGSGYRIVVSNLHGSVSQSDIRELFEDVGQLIDARLVRTGVAEVIFEKLQDAQTAVDTYHNRQLDGQPMKCLLVNPRASNKPTAPAIRPSKK